MSRLLSRLKLSRPTFKSASPRLQQQQLAPSRAYATSFDHPSPPKLPASEQAEFERLQREAAVSTAFAPTPSPGASTSSESQQQQQAQSKGDSDGERDPNQGIFRGAPPEFEGDVNPKTGEVGGPKNEPLRWGGHGEWSYNGRATDF